MRLFQIFVTVVSVACASAATAIASDVRSIDPLPTDRHEKVDAIFAPWNAKNGPGCAVGVSRNGDVDYLHGYGMSNLEYDIPVTPQSIFLAASVSKQFTAFAVALLAQEGKLSWDDDIRKYIPEMPDYGKKISISHLIHHTNGLRDQGVLLNLAGWRSDDLYTEGDMLWIVTKQRQTNFAPGTEIVYGNSAYTLLAVIVRRVSGKSLKDYAAERIFIPLGMTKTHFHDDHTEIVPGRVSGYRARTGGGWQISNPNFTFYGSTGVHTTAGDMLKWNQNLMDARVGGRKLIAWMLTSGRLNDGTETTYGGGLDLKRYRGLRVVGHSGVDAGFRAHTSLFPEFGLAIVALCNGSTIDPQSLIHKVAEVYLGEHMTAPALAPAVSTPQPEATLALLAGTYWSTSTDEVVRVEWRDGALRQQGNPAAFVQIGDGVFRPETLPHEWRFTTPAGDANVPVTLSIRDSWPTTRSFQRIADPMPSAAVLSSFAGQYRSQDTDATFTVTVDGNKLALAWPHRFVNALEPVGGDRFVSADRTITFLRDANGAVSGLTITTRRLRRLPAERL